MSLATTEEPSSNTLSPEVLKAAAKAAKLRYVSDRSKGIRRERTKDGFDFFSPSGTKITDSDDIARIRKLAIPPAYEDVWICVHANGHLQATGRDARGRKQYRYHPKWREVRDEGKYGKMLLFAKSCPPSASGLKRTWRNGACRGRRCSPPSSACWRAP